MVSKRQLVIGSSAVGGAMFLLGISRRRRPPPPLVVPPEIETVARLIELEARRRGVDPRIALAFAEVESNFSPMADNPADAPSGAAFREKIADNPTFADNPFRNERELWGAKGLFQLLPMFFLPKVDASADPRVLLSPVTNIRLGVQHIKRLLEREDGDVIRARLAYVCGDDDACSSSKERIVRDKINKALDNWNAPRRV